MCNYCRHILYCHVVSLLNGLCKRPIEHKQHFKEYECPRSCVLHVRKDNYINYPDEILPKMSKVHL